MPKKSLGQHFLTAPRYAEKIAQSVPARVDGHVLEVGPGNGALSLLLEKRFPGLHMVEIDPDLAAGLREKIGVGTWTLHVADILSFDIGRVGRPLHVVGNLPYNRAAMVIRKCLTCAPDVASVTFMVQRDVAKRIVAGTHTRQNGFLSIFCQFFGSPRILFHVPRGAFFPKPKVDSSVFQLVIAPAPGFGLPRHAWESFFRFVTRGFSMRRKTLAKALAMCNEHGKRELQQALREQGLDPAVRAEDLGVEEWVSLFRSTRD